MSKFGAGRGSDTEGAGARTPCPTSSAAYSQRSLQSLVDELYDFSAVGGPLHIATDDGNLRDSDLDFCEDDIDGHWSIEQASSGDAERIKPVCREIIRRLRAMPYRERLERHRADSW